MADMKAGVKAAVETLDAAALARQSAAERADAGTQADLFGAGAGAALDPAEDARLDEQLPLGQSEPARRGPGRPKGARNRRTTEVADYLVHRYGDPLEGLMVLGMGSLEHTALELHRAIQSLKAQGVPIARDPKGRELVGVDLNEVLKIKRAALEAVLPYIHARRAPTDEKGNVALPIMNIGMFAAAPQGAFEAGKGMSIEDVPYTVRHEENQGLSDSAGERSHDEASHDEG